MNDQEEQAYIRGGQAAYRRILLECMRGLDAEDVSLAALISERSATIAVLREVCARYGDNEWPDDLHLTDIIEKHLIRHIEDRIDEARDE